MKKFSKILIILILMILPKSVFAYDYEHILLVEKFNVSGSDVTIEGYSYISHQDNYGIKNDKGNLKTYILVYKGSWNSAYANIATCDENVNCLSFKTDVVARDMWWARCTDKSCLNQDNSMKRADNKSLINDDSCVDASNTCLYYNVGFKKTISLSTIMNKFSNNEGNVNEEIGFRIVSVAFKNDGSSVARTVNSGVAVHTDVCYVNGAKCNSNNVNSGDYSFQLDEFSKTVNYDASISIPRKENGDRVGNIDPVDGFIPVAYFLENEEYEIKSFSPSPEELTVTKGGKTDVFKDSLIQLESETSPDNYKETGCKAVVPAGYTGDSGAGTSPYDYWTLANFVTFNGDLKLRGLKLNVVTVNCGVFGDSSNSSNEISCNSSGEYKQCVSKAINATIYVKSISNSCKNSGSINKATINGSLYVPVNIDTDVLFNQEATFTFGNITPDSVRAGKAFSLGSTSYSNKVTWMNAKMYENSKKPYYKYDYKDADYLNGSCSLIENLNINDVSGNNKYCYAKDGGGHECGNDLMTISLLAIKDSVTAGAEVKINDVAKKHLESNISFISCNSNDSSGCYNGNATEPVGGIWNIIGDVVDEKFSYDGHERGRIITQNFNYSLYDSYVSLFGDNAGEVIYSDGSTSYSETEYYKGVNKYYVDFKYANFIWPFDLNGESDPSFVDSMDWSLKGTCDVGVDDGYYDIPGDPDSGDPGNPDPGTPNTLVDGFLYRYRSISLSKPFPNANGDFSNIAPNWKDWFKETTNQNRISGTYDPDKVPIYKITFDKGVTFSVDDYTSMATINPEGDSTFIDSKFSEIASNRSYCPVGYFIGVGSDSCDEY